MYREVFGRLEFAEFRKYPMTRESTTLMEVKWSYLMDDQLVIPLLDLESTVVSFLRMRCQKTPIPEAHKLNKGAEYPMELLVVVDTAEFIAARSDAISFRIIVRSEAVIRSPIMKTPFILPRKREVNIRIHIDELEKMDLKSLYAYLASAIVQSRFLDELSNLFEEECIEYTKRKYCELVEHGVKI